ncbi:hypothetical protein ACWO80_003474 [Vibrio cholerae]
MRRLPKWITDSPTDEIYPEFYHYRGKTQTDKPWLKKQLARLSRQNRITACLEYSNTYLLLGRKEANSGLIQFVSEHGLTMVEVQEVKRQFSGNEKAIFEKLEKIKNMKPIARSKYGEIFAPNVRSLRRQ